MSQGQRLMNRDVNPIRVQDLSIRAQDKSIHTQNKSFYAKDQ